MFSIIGPRYSCWDGAASGYDEIYFHDYATMENKRKETLYVEPPGYFQIVKRWWYGEDRTTTFNYLDKYFTEFIRFLDSILL